MHADSLFTSLGGARDLACTECSSAIEARAAVTVQNCKFEKAISALGSRYIRAYKGGSVRMEGNTFAAATKILEVSDSGALSSLNYLLCVAQPYCTLNRSRVGRYCSIWAAIYPQADVPSPPMQGPVQS
jgi:hypothetical protein